MEQSGAFREAQATITALEKNLAVCRNINQLSEQAAKEAEREIEEHFAKCFNALAARKADLLDQVTQHINVHKKSVGDARVQLESSMEACNKIMEGAKLVYPINVSAAEDIIKGLARVPIPNVTDTRVTTYLPLSLLQFIRTHGKVDTSNRYSVAEMVTTIAGSTSGNVNGNGLNTRFNYPWGICFNPHDDCMYICDTLNQAIKKLTLQGDVSTFVSGNGLSTPTGIVMSDKSFFVVNQGSHTISKISATGTVTVVAGSGQKGSVDGVGTKASFLNPRGVAIDALISKGLGTLHTVETSPAAP